VDRSLWTTFSPERGHELAAAAVASLCLHALTPTPEAYAVWFAYHSGVNPELRGEIDGHVSAGRAIDDVICEAWHTTYFTDLSLSDRMAKAGGRMASEIQVVMRDIQSAGARTKAYTQQLETARDALAQTSGAIGGHAVRQVVDDLASATADMARNTTDLQRKLTDTSREVTALREQLEQVRMEASTDSLTGLSNRKVFETALAAASVESDRTRNPVALILCDIDFFKRVNDNFGHQTGDQVIRFVATVMQRAAPQGCTVARLGGEEFAMLCPGLSVEAAMHLAERVRQMVETKRLVRRASNEDLGQITVSLGVAGRKPHEKGSDLTERADAALYASKRGGRNRTSLDDGASAAAA
jgi:diguanylate cyclase